MDPIDFERMSRDELVERGRALGVERPELMTRVELRDEIVRRSEPDPIEQRRARGWLGVARDLVASVVESGLNLPDAAALIRGREFDGHGPPPVATVTLAQIYAAQGHHARAVAVLDQVLAKEPDHAAARALRDRFLESGRTVPVPPPPAPPIEAQAEAAPEGDDAAGDEPAPQEVPAVFEAELSATPASAPGLGASDGEPDVPPETDPEPEPPTEQRPMDSADAALRADAVAEEPPTFVPESPARRASVLVARAPGSAPSLLWDLGDLAVSAAPYSIEYRVWKVSGDGIVRRQGELVLDARRGRADLPAGEADALIRAALGYRSGDRFVPVAIASEVSLANGGARLEFRAPTAVARELEPSERELVAGLGSASSWQGSAAS